LLTKQLANLSAGAALGGGLVIICLWPELANISVIVAQVLALGICFFTRSWADLRRPAAALPLVAAALLLFAFGITATSPLHIASILVFAPLFLIGPLITVFSRTSFRIGPGMIGTLAAIGAALAMLVAVYDAFVLHSPRAGGIVANPIHFADVVVALGFLSLVGLFGEKRSKWVAVAGALFALIAVVLSGTRGAIVTIIPVAGIILVLAALWGGLGRRSWLVVGVLVLIAVGGVVGTIQSGWSPVTRVIATATSMLETGKTEDSSDNARMLMYQAAYNAFLQSPFYGHGMIGFTKIAADTMPPELNTPVYDHLHNDVADFAVTGGIIGVIAYFCILLSPIAEAWTARGPHRRSAQLGAITLSSAYFLMGLTNATFGILMLTVTFAVAAAAIAHLSRLPARDLSVEEGVVKTPETSQRLADAPIA